MKTPDEITPCIWRERVADVLHGRIEKWEDRNECVAPDKVLQWVESLGWKHVPPAEGGMLSTNGWDYDWWLKFEKGKGKLRFTASGSGYYGGFAFQPSDPE